MLSSKFKLSYFANMKYHFLSGRQSVMMRLSNINSTISLNNIQDMGQLRWLSHTGKRVIHTMLNITCMTLVCLEACIHVLNKDESGQTHVSYVHMPKIKYHNKLS